MVKLKEFSNSPPITQRKQIPSKSDPFYVIYNHRRALRARALKLLKKEKLKQEKKVFLAQQQALKEQNMKNWNYSMLREDDAYQNAYEIIKKQVKQQDSTITRLSQFDQKLEKTRLQIIYSFSLSQKLSIFQNKFLQFGEEWLGQQNQVSVV